MIRVGSQLAFCSPNTIRQRTVVELDDQHCIERIFSLDDANVESAETLFYDGILSSGIVSLKQNTSAENISKLINEYQYFDFSENIPLFNLKLTNKPLILDFGTNSTDRFNDLLPDLYRLLSGLSIFDIIAACTYNPYVISGYKTGLSEGFKTGLILWENTDLVHRKLTETTKIRELSRYNQEGKTKLD